MNRAAAIKGQTSVDVLRACPLFRELDEEGCHQLANRSRRQAIEAGETIFEIGTAGGSMMAVLEGQVRISLPSANGREIILADLGPGEVFGEIALLDGRPRTATATARRGGSLLVLDRREVLTFLSSRSDFCLKVIELLCARLRRSDERMADIAFFDLPVRLSKVLLATKRADETLVPHSQSDLAKMVGSSREQVNRCLSDWQKRGFVRVESGRLHLLQVTALKAVADAGGDT